MGPSDLLSGNPIQLIQLILMMPSAPSLAIYMGFFLASLIECFLVSLFHWDLRGFLSLCTAFPCDLHGFLSLCMAIALGFTCVPFLLHCPSP